MNPNVVIDLPDLLQNRQAAACESIFERREHNPAFRAALELEVARAERYLVNGLELVPLMPRRLRVDVALFARGGLAILEKIRQIKSAVMTRSGFVLPI